MDWRNIGNRKKRSTKNDGRGGDKTKEEKKQEMRRPMEATNTFLQRRCTLEVQKKGDLGKTKEIHTGKKNKKKTGNKEKRGQCGRTTPGTLKT